MYRVLFLLFAEARALVPIWNDVYRDAYTIDALTQAQPARRVGAGTVEGASGDLAARARGCRAGDLEVTAFNGRLFSPRHSPLVERGRCRTR